MEIQNNLSKKALYDYELVKHALIGDEKAYSELYKRYREPVYFLCFQLLNNKTNAENLMFETFERAFSYLYCYSPNFAFSTWLFKLTAELTLDFIQKKKNLSHHFIKYSDEKGAVYAYQTELIREQTTLPKELYKKIFELRYFDELSYEEISQAMNLSIETVKTHLRKTRQLLLNIVQNLENK